MSNLKAQAEVFATLGDYTTLKNFVETKLLLTPVDLWAIYQALPEDLNHCDHSNTKAIQVARAVVRHPNLAPEQVLFFLNHKKTCLKQRALIHPNFPLFILNKLVQDLINQSNAVKLNKVLANPSVGGQFIDQILDKALWQEGTVLEHTRNYLCRHAFKPEHFLLLESLTKLSVPDNLALLKNPHTSESLLTKLSDYFWHCEEFYLHPKVSPELKRKALSFVKANVPYLYNKFSSLTADQIKENSVKAI
jgi:hypothetical protein